MADMSPSHPLLSRQQWITLITLTLVWGFNWPMLKIGVTNYPALSFRIISMWIAIPFLALVIWRWRMPFVIPRRHWSELLQLMVSNYLVWYSLVILALPYLNSGRTAILGYTMPIFSAVLGYVIYRDPLKPRAILGVVCASVAVLLLLWHELTSLAGSPWALATVLARRGVNVMIADVRAVFIGTKFAQKVSMKLVHGIAAGVFAVLGVITLLNVTVLA